jgi:YHS domain-containing protein
MKAVDKNNSGEIDYSGKTYYFISNLEFVAASINR